MVGMGVGALHWILVSANACLSELKTSGYSRHNWRWVRGPVENSQLVCRVGYLPFSSPLAP